uniref:Uncharacterized protein n=1 Tax=Anguilla anguilla TaxID=7936 RepID=A0A0E9U5X6_ANGAN
METCPSSRTSLCMGAPTSRSDSPSRFRSTFSLKLEKFSREIHSQF